MRLIAIGGAYLMPKAPEYAHWGRLGSLFGTPIAGDKVVNVVCAPVGMSLGTRQTLQSITGKQASGNETISDEEQVYEPQTALSGLYTDGMRNVSITGCLGNGQEPDKAEVAALNRYPIVVCATTADEHTLLSCGVEIPTFLNPEDLAKMLSAMDWG